MTDSQRLLDRLDAYLDSLPAGSARAKYVADLMDRFEHTFKSVDGLWDQLESRLREAARGH